MNIQLKSILFFDEKITAFLLVIYFLFLTLFPLVSIIALIVLTCYFLLSGKIGKSITLIKSDRILKIFVLYYFLYVFGMLYTSNLNYGLEDLQIKLSFLVVPIVFAGLTISKHTFERIKLTFIFSSIVSLLVFILFAAKNYSYNSDWGDFTYTNLSHGRHPTYLTIYFNLAMLFILDKHYTKSKEFPLLITAILFFFLYIGVLLLSSRTATFVTILSSSIYPVLHYGRSFFNQRKWRTHLCFLSLMILFLFTYLNFYNRFDQVEQEISLRFKSDSNDLIKEVPNSTNIRLNLWKNSIELIGRNLLFGVGTGDLKEELVKIYKENNYQYGVQKRASPHNQFLHIGIILGLCGILFLFIYFLLPLFLALKKHDWLYVLFLFIIILNCITESLFEREAGVLFFTVFNTIFYLQMRSKAKHTY